MHAWIVPRLAPEPISQIGADGCLPAPGSKAAGFGLRGADHDAPIRAPRAGGKLCPRLREAEVKRLRDAQPKLTATPLINEEFTVREDPTRVTRMENGVLTLDDLSAERSRVLAMTVAQSASMEYYEPIVEEMFGRTDRLVERMEARGWSSCWTWRAIAGWSCSSWPSCCSSCSRS